VSWLIRPLLEVESKRWRMTAANTGPQIVAKHDTGLVRVVESSPVTANLGCSHSAEDDCWKCERCRTWKDQFKNQ
jgi:hypothetical protein